MKKKNLLLKVLNGRRFGPGSVMQFKDLRELPMIIFLVVHHRSNDVDQGTLRLFLLRTTCRGTLKLQFEFTKMKTCATCRRKRKNPAVK